MAEKLQEELSEGDQQRLDISCQTFQWIHDSFWWTKGILKLCFLNMIDSRVFG